MRRLTAFVALCVFALCALGDFKPTSVPTNGTTRATVDIPVQQHIRNVGGSDGAGLCVFTSVELAARWQNVATLHGFQKWMTQRPGGGWPEKLDDMIAQYTGGLFTDYLQHTGGDVAFLDACMQTGRSVAVTYNGRDDFYGRARTIAHMVNLAYLDQNVACIIDNNRPEVWVWMTRAEFVSRWSPRRDGWAVVLLGSPPPPYDGKIQVSYEQCYPNGYCFAEWVDKPGQFGVFKSGVFLGTWHVEKQTWDGKEAVPPIPEHLKKPQAPLLPLLNEPNYGIDRSKITEEAYSCGGKKCSRTEAFDVLFEDDSALPYLTVVGDKTFFAKVRADVEALGLSDKLHLQLFAPGSWQQTQFKLPDGVSLRKPAKMVRVSQEVGKLSPDKYDVGALRDLLRILFPNLSPGPTSPVVPTPRVAVNVDFWTLLLIGVGLYLFSRKP